MSRENYFTEERVLDLTLRPKSWENYVGQEKIKNNLKIIIEAAKQRKESIEHLLFYGGSGLGKTTLAHLVAKEIKKETKTTSGPAIEKPGDLAAILTNLEPGSILFIDEIHRLNRITEEYLYPAMESFKLNLILGRGPMAKIMEMNLPFFTLIGATTQPALLSSPLRARFGASFGLDFYQIFEIEKILERSTKILNVETEGESLKIIAKASRFTPRVANNLLKRVRDFAQVKGKGTITPNITKEALLALEIDELGLTSQDRKILEIIIKKFNGGPVGLQALAAATMENENSILDIYEPYLMRLGFIERNPKGRIATKLAFQHLKTNSQKLFDFLNLEFR
ncbi:Holliday junction branch migration DNA helicase RuvB [bacterium (Candidatus Gribaldobacteria) CG07_land_8_20_14_0_80_33_18]|uniref:Holliday junction branch migration complex subunit RuvB n=1 Tax=bacterium (Candidatus Gribaldobacteria) CG07_land_8_20_14_0_80_33_18 TaxID=2014272 RepID=A0A2M6Z224_9BACT|nr:MAG: Holliday junction branch migration DNA helicase RuvB [bacterium (Candidatus Gribaldobacteria) CG10_big_fil_rev_8_21_14_0_10_33_41]PIU46395.1 MAG: Holliday junction branch migration DNA helicase RuvB [bacterium (Candidatus Gribaldobacteria) CG07_land_8_20_14_0_80_33_18]PJA01018.1 MAG: Holliday junction branch migration DNA helicase RuvB [bacterium (Candidatus Gribaldobacteria) CG_4_10_14_0_2_um_filter_33_15]PJB08540.1 MAG: Holliday junction branch migration DNA helicase RuvB [bacterium (C